MEEEVVLDIVRYNNAILVCRTYEHQIIGRIDQTKIACRQGVMPRTNKKGENIYVDVAV
jgi:hypothetical protein